MPRIHFFNVEAAKEIGPTAAAVLHVIAAKVKVAETLGENQADGRAWMRGGQIALCDECPYITPRTMRTVVKTLTDADLVEVGKHFDRFSCFTLKEKARAILGITTEPKT